MQGIKTARHGSYATRASCESKTIIIGRNDGLSHDKQHREAAMKLATLMGWHGKWVGATVPGVQGVVWVCVDEKIEERVFEVPRES